MRTRTALCCASTNWIRKRAWTSLFTRPVALAPRLAARLKVMAQLDISERRVPQDGRIKMRLSRTQAIDFRVNTLPTIFGEKVVLRILDPASAQLGIEAHSRRHHFGAAGEASRAGSIVSNQIYRPLLVFGVVGAMFFAMCWPLSLYGRMLERRMSAGQSK